MNRKIESKRMLSAKPIISKSVKPMSRIDKENVDTLEDGLKIIDLT